MSELDDLAAAVRAHPGLTAKAAIGLVAEDFPADWLAGPGDDGAVVEAGPERLVVGGEAIYPSFVAADPFGAGIAAVLANVNDLAAMGAEPLAIVDTVTGPGDALRAALGGMRYASGLYDVPVVGGHLTLTESAPTLSAFGLGRAHRVLSARNATAGQPLLLAACLDGRMRADFPFFPSFDERGDRLAGDVRTLAAVAREGLAVAAKDVSMAGVVGSLAMLLECNRLGLTLDLDALPRPPDVPLPSWLVCFPCFAFLLCVPAGAEADCAAAFHERGLAAAVVGVLDDSGLLRLAAGGGTTTVMDLTREPVTGLHR